MKERPGSHKTMKTVDFDVRTKPPSARVRNGECSRENVVERSFNGLWYRTFGRPHDGC